MDCIFCKIANKEIGSYLVYEDEIAVGVLDIHPLAPGHVMIIPKNHAENILGISEDIVAGVFAAVKKATDMINKSLKPDGFTIGINHGRASGNTIDHLHIHIIPRWQGDGGGSIHSVVKNPPRESLDEIMSLIEKFKPKV